VAGADEVEAVEAVDGDVADEGVTTVVEDERGKIGTAVPRPTRLVSRLPSRRTRMWRGYWAFMGGATIREGC
jgi:hypothetical protein